MINLCTKTTYSRQPPPLIKTKINPETTNIKFPRPKLKFLQKSKWQLLKIKWKLKGIALFEILKEMVHKKIAHNHLKI